MSQGKESAGSQFLFSTQKSKENDIYENMEKIVMGYVFAACTDKCLLTSKTSEINAKEKNCLSHCYDASLFELEYKNNILKSMM